MHIKMFLLVSLFFSIGFLLQAKTIQQKMIIEIQEKVQEIVFKHVIESGFAQKESFFVNNIAISKPEYYERLEQAEKEEREYLRRQQEDLLHKKVEFVTSSQVSIYQKMLSKVFIDIKQWITKLSFAPITAYYVFSPDTVSSQAAFDTFKNEIFSKADQMMHEYIQQQNVDNLKKLFEQYENVPQRLERFFQKSVQYAIKHCDDTKLLKELLGMLGSND